MKKLFSFLFLLFLLSFFSCDRNKISPEENTFELEGYWYEETYNEEVHFMGNGTYYDKYANMLNAAETEGSFEYNAEEGTLTMMYKLLGKNNFVDNDIVWKDNDHFTMSSSSYTGLNLDRIVSRHTIEVGETDLVNTEGYEVVQFVSSNPGIASVDEQGQIKAEGEKGTTYIKIETSQGNVWASVTVGDNNYDLWCDYTSIIGMTYAQLREAFLILGEPVAVDDEGDYFCYMTPEHTVLDHILILLDKQKDAVTAVQLILRESVTELEINNYLNSRYFIKSDGESKTFYTNDDIHDSNVLVFFSFADKCISLCDKYDVFVSGLWGIDYSYVLGKDKSAVRSYMEAVGCTFAFSDYYFTPTGRCAYVAGYVFNPDNQASQVWIYLDGKATFKQVYGSIEVLYYVSDEESTATGYVFFDKDRKIKVIYDLVNNAVIYWNINMKQHEQAAN